MKTPGPWYHESDGEGRPRQRRDQYIVAIGGLGRVATCHWIEDGHPTDNARLIAAAPELLAALEGFAEQATKLQGFPHLYDPYVGAVLKAKEAIAKAREGGQ